MDSNPNALLWGGALVFIEYLIVSYAIFFRRPLIASGLILTAFIVETAFITLPAVPAGISLYLPDLVFLPLLIVGMARIVLSQKAPPQQLVSLAIVGVFLVSFVRGASSFGILDAGVEARLYFYFLAGVLYFSSFSLTDIDSRKIVNQWLLACVAMSGIAMFRWTATLIGLPIAESWSQFSGGAGGGNFRVLQSSHAMTIAVGLLLSLQFNLSKSGSTWQRNLVYLFAPVVLVLQHRTVWVVCLLGISWLFVSHPAYRRHLISWLSGLAITAAILVVVFGGSSTSHLTTAIQASSKDTGTLEWRIEGWKQLLTSEQGFSLMDRLFGAPFGSGYARVVEGFLTEVSPHSFYVQTLLRLGILGTGLLAIAYVMALRRSAAPDLHGGLPSNSNMTEAWNVVLVAVLVYFVTYAPTYELAVPLGVALGASLPSRASVDALNRIQAGKESNVVEFTGSTPHIA